MRIPVYWLTFHEDAPTSGYWDQGWLHRVLTGAVRTTRYEYDNREERVSVLNGMPVPQPTGGGVVVLPGSYNAPYAAQVNEWLSYMPWVVLFITSDEESLFPIERLTHPRMIVYVEPDIRRKYDPGVRFLGMQCKADTPALLDPHVNGDRPTDVYFAGQVTHARRERCRDAIEACRSALTVDAVYTESFTAGLSRDEYLRRMAAAKVVPCPSGPAIADSFRLWEALEAGCVPVADARCEGTPEGYWERAFGDPGFPIIDDWSLLPSVAEFVCAFWPSSANRVQAWWQEWQRRFVVAFEDAIADLSGVPPTPRLGDLLTVIMPTSPIESHPSTDVLNRTLSSVQERLPGVEVIVGFDGVRPEQEKFIEAYAWYVNRALTQFAFDRYDVLPLLHGTWGHQANVTRMMLNFVRTPTVLFVEHDCPLVGDIPFVQIVDAVAAGEANVVRLLHEAGILEPHRYLMLHDHPHEVAGLPMMGTVQWSQRPHVASTAYYRRILNRYFGRDSRTMIEDVMHGVLQQTAEHGGWGMDRVFIYAPPGDMQRSTTTDGRGSEPKFDMLVAYDGDTPDFAPRPTVETDEYKQPGEA